jgi:hypothetical protein
MTEAEQRIALAKWCGWKKCAFDDKSFYVPMMGHVAVACDPIHDLNAMREAEKRIACEQWWGYVIALNHKVCEDADEPSNDDPETSFCMVHSSATQRAEALLRTIEKWKP